MRQPKMRDAGLESFSNQYNTGGNLRPQLFTNSAAENDLWDLSGVRAPEFESHSAYG